MEKWIDRLIEKRKNGIVAGARLQLIPFSRLIQFTDTEWNLIELEVVTEERNSGI